MSGLTQGGWEVVRQRVGALGVLVAVAFLVMTASALATTTVMCLNPVANGALKAGTGVGGSAPCKSGWIEIAKYETAGVAGKPTVQFSGVNVQVVAGPKESETTGKGNLVVGNDEGAKTQTGSNNLILGGEQEFTSYGALLAGRANKALGPYGDVFGIFNAATGEGAAASGGSNNNASGQYASVSGGYDNIASESWASVSGGHKALASGPWSSVSGGYENEATGNDSWVGGGEGNLAGTGASSVSGGGGNVATGGWASVSGGLANRATNQWASVQGGWNNIAEGEASSIFGGTFQTAKNNYEYLPSP